MKQAVQQITKGFGAFPHGVRWLKQHPKYFLLILIPQVLGLFMLVFAMGTFHHYLDTIMGWALFDEPDSWWLLPLYYMSYGLVYLAAWAIGFVAMILVINICAAPLYDVVSVAVEREARGGQVQEISIWAGIRMIPEELKKALCILGISMLLLFIPGINVISIFITAFLIGWDLYDYPMARRGAPFAERWRSARRDFLALTAFGLWLMIPFLQFFLLPLAVPGGTWLQIQCEDAV